MTYKEQRAAEHTAELAEPVCHFEQWPKDHKSFPLQSEPVVDRDNFERKARLLKKIRKTPNMPEMACNGPLADPSFDCGEDEDGNVKPKAATHAGDLKSLVYRLQKDPTDKGTLSELLCAVHDDAALERFAGKFSEGFTVNESWTGEDTAEVIETAQRIAALPLSNIPWPDPLDHTEEAEALRVHVWRLSGMPEDIIEGRLRESIEIGLMRREYAAAQKEGRITLPEYATAQEPAAQEQSATDTKEERLKRLKAAIPAGDPTNTSPYLKDHPELCYAIENGTGYRSRIIHVTRCPGAESCPVKHYEDEKGEQENAEMEAALCQNREPETLTLREMIVEHGINPTNICGLEEWGNLRVEGTVYWEHLSENGVIFECAENTRLWLLCIGEKFTIEVAPWNLAEGGPYGPFIDTTCRPWEDADPPMSEYDWVKAHVDPRTQELFASQESEDEAAATGENGHSEYSENQPDRHIGERGYCSLKLCDMLDDLNITVEELEAFAKAHNLPWPGCDDTQIASVEWECAMADLAVLYGVETGQCNKDGRMIPNEPIATEGDGYQQWADIKARRERKG